MAVTVPAHFVSGLAPANSVVVPAAYFVAFPGVADVVEVIVAADFVAAAAADFLPPTAPANFVVVAVAATLATVPGNYVGVPQQRPNAPSNDRKEICGVARQLG
ncbi:hypothetical protein [Nocardia camponoti]|uniref:hypothetical protein n=1 Tax=Nocardia camponoti TaxID=1616106 RepID=UPI00166BC507|nr:hypothetical protein [Nocardia camponoti]